MKQGPTEDFLTGQKSKKKLWGFSQEYARNFDSVNVYAIIPKRAKSISLLG